METPTALTLPAGVETDGGSLRASPDGTQLLLTLPTTINGTTFMLLYVVNLDGTGWRQVTRPSDRAATAGARLAHSNAVWSPDGRWIAFSVRGVNPGVPGFNEVCQPVLVIPSNLNALAIDGLSDAADAKLTVTGADGAKKVINDCGGWGMSWQ